MLDLCSRGQMRNRECRSGEFQITQDNTSALRHQDCHKKLQTLVHEVIMRNED